MIEVYGFLVMFAVQVLVLSVLLPGMLARRVRMVLTRYPVEQFPQLYPEGSGSFAGGFAIYRALNWVAAVVGLTLLAWLYGYMQQPDWRAGRVAALATVYMAAQFIPLVLLGVTGAKLNRKFKSTFPEDKRRATLRPRGLFDFVSPAVVGLAALGYVMYVTLVLYIGRHPFRGFAGAMINIGIITLTYALMGLFIYLALYGRKRSPLQTQANRLRTIEIGVKGCVYTCLAIVVLMSLTLTLQMFELMRWQPFALSVYFVYFALRTVSSLNATSTDINLDALRIGPRADR